MVVTKHSQLSSETVQNPADALIVTGAQSESTAPGEYVVFTGGTWTLANSGTAAHKLLTGGVVVWRARKNTSGTDMTVDDDYTTATENFGAQIPVCTSGIVVIKIIDQNATRYPGTPFMISGTAGALDILAQEATGATSGTAIKSVHVATLLRKIVDGDLYGFFGIGEFLRKRGSY